MRQIPILMIIIFILFAKQLYGPRIHDAVIHNKINKARRILTDDPSCTRWPDVAWGGWPPLHYAAFCKHLEMVKLLLDHGAPINVTNIMGKTALDYTREDVFDYLKSRGACLGKELTWSSIIKSMLIPSKK